MWVQCHESTGWFPGPLWRNLGMVDMGRAIPIADTYKAWWLFGAWHSPWHLFVASQRGIHNALRPRDFQMEVPTKEHA